MSIDKSKIRKLSDKELLGYLKEDNKFVGDACEIAFDILIKERNHNFSEAEIIRIKHMIINKRSTDFLKDNDLDDNIVIDAKENEQYVKMYSKTNIIVLGAILSPLVCFYMLFENLRTGIKLEKGALIKIVLVLVGAFLLLLIFDQIILVLVYLVLVSLVDLGSVFGFDILQLIIRIIFTYFTIKFTVDYLWKNYIGETKYRSKDITLPLIVAILLAIFLGILLPFLLSAGNL